VGRCGGADLGFTKTFARPLLRLNGCDPEEERDGSDDFEVQETSFQPMRPDFAQFAVGRQCR